MTPTSTWPRPSRRSTRITGTPGGALQGVKGYEFHAKMAKTYAKLTTSPEEIQKKALQHYLNLSVVGTPRQCLEKLEYIQQRIGTDHFLFGFSHGGLPLAKAERSMRLTAEKDPAAPQARPGLRAPRRGLAAADDRASDRPDRDGSGIHGLQLWRERPFSPSPTFSCGRGQGEGSGTLQASYSATVAWAFLTAGTKKKCCPPELVCASPVPPRFGSLPARRTELRFSS